MNSHWQIWLVSQQQPPSVNPFFAMLWQPPLQLPIPSPGDYDGIAQQTPGLGRSVPSRHQTNHGHRLAVAPYTQQPHESVRSIRGDYSTGAYPGMAQISPSNSRTDRTVSHRGRRAPLLGAVRDRPRRSLVFARRDSDRLDRFIGLRGSI